MELSALSENVVPVPFKHGGESVELQVNIDAFTPEFFRKLTATFQSRLKGIEAQAAKEKKDRKKKDSAAMFDSQAAALEMEREINVDFLVPHVLKGWDVTKDGTPIAPSR